MKETLRRKNYQKKIRCSVSKPTCAKQAEIESLKLLKMCLLLPFRNEYPLLDYQELQQFTQMNLNQIWNFVRTWNSDKRNVKLSHTRSSLKLSNAILMILWLVGVMPFSPMFKFWLLFVTARIWELICNISFKPKWLGELFNGWLDKPNI